LLVAGAAREFVEPGWARVHFWAGFFLIVAFPTFLLVLAITQRSVAGVILGVAFAVVAVPLILEGIFFATQVGSRVVVTSDAVAARSILGRTTSLRWEDIGEVREFVVSGFGGLKRKQARLFSETGNSRIALDARLRGFDELLEIVHERTAHARRTTDERSWWRRQFLPG